MNEVGTPGTRDRDWGEASAVTGSISGLAEMQTDPNSPCFVCKRETERLECGLRGLIILRRFRFNKGEPARGRYLDLPAAFSFSPKPQYLIRTRGNTTDPVESPAANEQNRAGGTVIGLYFRYRLGIPGSSGLVKT